LGGIAYRYKVTLAALMAANPKVDPRLLKVGSTLVIPVSSEVSPTEGLPSPTPVGLSVGPGVCTPSQAGGVWCFALVTNQQKNDIESITALMHLSDPASGKSYTQTAQTPLDMIPAGASLPLAAYFPPPTASIAQASVELQTALPVAPDSGRYLAVKVVPGQVNIALDGLSATVTGQVQLTAKKGSAGQVWVALIAYDESGQVVGARRWQSPGALSAGASTPFSAFVYSTGEKITRVETWAQARP